MVLDAANRSDSRMNTIMMLLPWLAAILVFLLVLLIGFVVVQAIRERQHRRLLEVIDEYGNRGRVAPTESRKQDGASASLFDRLANVFVTARMRAFLLTQLVYAGRPSPEAVSSLARRKVLYGVIGLILGILLALGYGGWAWVWVPVIMIAGFFAPDLIVYNEGLRRNEEIGLALPDALDLLNLCVESGLSLQAGLGRVANSQRGPVAAEISRVLQEMQFGSSREQAFTALANRTKQPDLLRFIAALQQVDRLGIPVSGVLREQSREMRLKRQARAREKAQQVSVKILIPMLLCFLPGLFIIILGPAIIGIVEAFSSL